MTSARGKAWQKAFKDRLNEYYPDIYTWRLFNEIYKIVDQDLVVYFPEIKKLVVFSTCRTKILYEKEWVEQDNFTSYDLGLAKPVNNAKLSTEPSFISSIGEQNV